MAFIIIIPHIRIHSRTSFRTLFTAKCSSGVENMGPGKYMRTSVNLSSSYKKVLSSLHPRFKTDRVVEEEENSLR